MKIPHHLGLPIDCVNYLLTLKIFESPGGIYTPPSVGPRDPTCLTGRSAVSAAAAAAMCTCSAATRSASERRHRCISCFVILAAVVKHLWPISRACTLWIMLWHHITCRRWICVIDSPDFGLVFATGSFRCRRLLLDREADDGGKSRDWTWKLYVDGYQTVSRIANNLPRVLCAVVEFVAKLWAYVILSKRDESSFYFTNIWLSEHKKLNSGLSL